MYYDVKSNEARLREMLTKNGGLRRVPTVIEDDRVTVGYAGGF